VLADQARPVLVRLGHVLLYVRVERLAKLRVHDHSQFAVTHLPGVDDVHREQRTHRDAEGAKPAILRGVFSGVRLEHLLMLLGGEHIRGALMLRRDGGCPFTGFWSVKKATGSKPSRAKPLAPAVLNRVGGMTDVVIGDMDMDAGGTNLLDGPIPAHDRV